MKRQVMPLMMALLLLLFSCGGKNEELAGSMDVPAEENVQVVENSAYAESTAAPKTDELAPVKKSGTAKFRIAVVQSGDYYGYSHILKGVIDGLTTVGWMNEVSIDDSKSMAEIVKVLADDGVSDYLDFDSAAYYDFNWEEPTVIPTKLEKIVNGELADLIISLGTTAGLIISQSSKLRIPVVAESISDPIGSGLVTSFEDSGKDLLTASCDPDQDTRQIMLFHSVIKFKKLGVIYTDTALGRSYGGIEAAEKLSGKLGFTIVKSSADLIEDPVDDQVPAAEKKYLAALQRIIGQVDALYLGIQGGLTLDNLSEIMKIVNQYKVPTFAMEGSDYVKNGVLLGESESNVISVGIYNAKKIAHILKGQKPRSLNQIFEHVPHIAINLKEAELIGYDVPIDIIASSDEIYLDIGGNDEKE